MYHDIDKKKEMARDVSQGNLNEISKKGSRAIQNIICFIQKEVWSKPIKIKELHSLIHSTNNIRARDAHKVRTSIGSPN